MNGGAKLGGMNLCVLVWARDGLEASLIAYEDRVLALVADHGGIIRYRARTRGEPGQPLEVHLIEFPSRDAFEAYLADDRRTALAAERDRVVARTEVLQVDRV